MKQDFNFNDELEGKIALVTGGTKGAGRAIAERLLRAGATVIITARNPPEKENSGLHFIAAGFIKRLQKQLAFNLRNETRKIHSFIGN